MDLLTVKISAATLALVGAADPSQFEAALSAKLGQAEKAAADGAAMNDRLAGIESKVSAVEGLLAGVEGRITAVDSKVDGKVLNSADVLSQATAAASKLVVETFGKAGNTALPAGNSGQDAPAGERVLSFSELVAEKVAGGMSKSAAVTAVVASHPKEHAAFLASGGKL